MIVHDGLAAAIVPCADIASSEAFFALLGYARPPQDTGEHADYRLLVNGRGGIIHLRALGRGEALDPAASPLGLYLYADDPEAAAQGVRDLILEPGRAPERKLWGMFEFSLNGPDGLLVRVGWPDRPR